MRREGRDEEVERDRRGEGVAVKDIDTKIIPHICHGCADGVRVNFFWPVKIFTDLTRKIGIFDRFYAKKWRFFFTDLTRKIGVFLCKF